jgi:hypothetical protein
MVDYSRGKLIDEFSQRVEISNLNEVAVEATAYEHQTTKKLFTF